MEYLHAASSYLARLHSFARTWELPPATNPNRAGTTACAQPLSKTLEITRVKKVIKARTAALYHSLATKTLRMGTVLNLSSKVSCGRSQIFDTLLLPKIW